VTIALAVGSVFALKALNARWLWMLQAATPFVTLGMLGCLDITVRPSSGDNLIVLSVCYTVISVPVLALLYAILIALNWTAGVFYVALLARMLMWFVGHQRILKAQVDMRSRVDRSQDESEERLQSVM
jgi:hypothetical protein